MLRAGVPVRRGGVELDQHLARQGPAKYDWDNAVAIRVVPVVVEAALSDRGVRERLERYAALAGIEHGISPHKLRHFLLTCLKKRGLDDALIQPYSGHASRQSLESAPVSRWGMPSRSTTG